MGIILANFLKQSCILAQIALIFVVVIASITNELIGHEVGKIAASMCSQFALPTLDDLLILMIGKLQ